jgi:hypothetical protein
MTFMGDDSCPWGELLGDDNRLDARSVAMMMVS